MYSLYPSSSYNGSNVFRLILSGNQVEVYITQKNLEYHLVADHARIIKRENLVSGNIHDFLSIYVLWKLQIQPAGALDSTYREIRYM